VLAESRPEALPTLRAALACVPGLAGFVGVDFLWEPERQSATVLEINPRVTTSHVGLAHLLPPGRLARAWLAACGAIGLADAPAEELSEFALRAAPIAFDVRGDVRPRGGDET
jgi:hypothetical protein